jgi:hypothetical protein
MHVPIPSARVLGLSKTLQFTSAPGGRTFFYSKRKNEDHGGHLPVIESGWEDPHRFRFTEGPFLYAVVDSAGQVKYMGKSWEKFLYQRWLRPQPHIHHKESRDFILTELNAGRGPLHMWSATATELKKRIPRHAAMEDRAFIKALEALWVHRWRDSLWNDRLEPLTPGFDDNEYWRAPA